MNKKLRNLVKYGLVHPLRRLRARVGRTARIENGFLRHLIGARIEEQTFFYESFEGKSVGCSPRAMCDALLRDERYANARHIWALKPGVSLPTNFANHPRVKTVKARSASYAKMLATSEYIISNSTLPAYYLRRDGQKYINFWHGVPLKKMFKDEDDRLTTHRNSQRNFLQASHILLPNEFAQKHLLESADIAELVAPQTHLIGAPRIDETLQLDRDELRIQLGVSAQQKVVFFAPTWRGTLGKDVLASPQSDDLLRALSQLNEQGFVVYFQGHNFVHYDKQLLQKVPAGLSTNTFLAAVDIMITDFSSIMFDFLPLERPLILFVPDRTEYEAKRGLNLTLEELPASICTTVGDVMDTIQAPDLTVDSQKLSKAKEQLFPLEDGRATARAIEVLRTEAPKNIQRARPRILIWAGGWKSNGITSSAINLLNALAQENLDVYVVTNGEEIDKTPQYADNINKVHKNIKFIHRCGRLPRSAAEDIALQRYYRFNQFDDAAHATLIKQVFQRESRRLFGDVEFDLAVDFSGYARYWSLLIAATPAKKHVCYQHNDLFSEAQKRFEILFGVFAGYRYYDAVAAVSDETRDVNQGNLAAYYQTELDVLTIRNVIDPDTIHMLAAGDPGLPCKSQRTRFVTIGRFSPEKAQSRAIKAFGKLLDEDGVDAELVIIGSGPLETELRALVGDLGLEDHVIFTGQLDNPFPILADSDCFVLTSDYEGQPMVLLEALTLGLPVISTDIPGARSVLGTGLGHLVPVNQEGVLGGMRAFVSGEVTPASFDAHAYRTQAVGDFLSLLKDG